MTCRWCQHPIRPKAIFCSDSCRAAFHKALRLAGTRLFEADLVSIETLKAMGKPYTARTAAKSEAG